MSAITTHILDTTLGKPAQGVPILLEFLADGWEALGRGVTDDDGRNRQLLSPEHALKAGRYRLSFDTAHYFRSLGTDGFYPEVTIQFEIKDGAQHYHVPLLLNPFGYATYRGS